MAFAISFNIIVLPVFGWATIIPLWPFPIGANKSIIRVDNLELLPERLNLSLGNNGVKCSNEGRSLTSSGSCPLIFVMRTNGKCCSFPFGGRTIPFMVSPFLSPNKRICDCEI